MCERPSRIVTYAKLLTNRRAKLGLMPTLRIIDAILVTQGAVSQALSRSGYLPRESKDPIGAPCKQMSLSFSVTVVQQNTRPSAEIHIYIRLCVSAEEFARLLDPSSGVHKITE